MAVTAEPLDHPLRGLRGEMDVSLFEGQYRVTSTRSSTSKVLTVGFSSNEPLPAKDAYYEAVIETRGTIVVGLVSPGFEDHVARHPHNSHVGDSEDSWGYDGTRRRKRCVHKTPYGARWKVNDVVSVELDKVTGELRFGLNGKALGLAFKIPLEHVDHVRPAISLDHGQSVLLNFGRAPFIYPSLVDESDPKPGEDVAATKIATSRGKGKGKRTGGRPSKRGRWGGAVAKHP